MMRVLGLLALLLTVGCAPKGPVVLDPALAKLVPPDSTMLAGIRMDAIRATPLFGVINEFGWDRKKEASELLIASNGKDVVTLERFRDGTTTAVPSGGIPAALQEKIESIATPNQVWLVSLGWNAAVDAAIPQSGNLSNLRRIYRVLESITVAADLRSGLDLIATGTCASDQNAKELADALRTFLSLGRLAARQDQAFYDAIQVEQSRQSIRVTAHVPRDLLDRFIRSSGSRTESPPPRRP